MNEKRIENKRGKHLVDNKNEDRVNKKREVKICQKI